MNLLLIEDERKLAAHIKKWFELKCGYVVDTVYDGEQGLLYACTYQYDLIILDILLPKKDGLAVLRELRAKRIKSPIILLTAKDSVDNKVLGLDSGADDYLTKPFEMRELVARAHALLRRTQEEKSPILTVDDLILDPAKRIVKRGSRELNLTTREFSLLDYLIR